MRGIMLNLGECPNCKQKNPYSKVVCDFCGSRLPWADAVQQNPAPSQPVNSPTPAAPAAPAPAASSATNPPDNVIVRSVIGAIVGLVIYWVIMIASGAGSATPLAPIVSPPIVTQSEYSQIQTGMTYEQVAAIVGDPGVNSQHQEMMGTTTDMYTWQNEDGSNLIVMMQNGQLINKTATSLP